MKIFWEGNYHNDKEATRLAIRAGTVAFTLLAKLPPQYMLNLESGVPIAYKLNLDSLDQARKATPDASERVKIEETTSILILEEKRVKIQRAIAENSSEEIDVWSVSNEQSELASRLSEMAKRTPALYKDYAYVLAHPRGTNMYREALNKILVERNTIYHGKAVMF